MFRYGGAEPSSLLRGTSSSEAECVLLQLTAGQTGNNWTREKKSFPQRFDEFRKEGH